jgi:hypothetical protein
VIGDVLFPAGFLLVWLIDAAQARICRVLFVVMDHDLANVGSRGIKNLAWEFILNLSSGSATVYRDKQPT